MLGSKSLLHRRLDAWLRARISSLIKALTRSPTPSIIFASDCVENVYVGSSQDPIPRSLRLRGPTSCLWSRNAPATCPSSAPLDLLDVGPRQSISEAPSRSEHPDPQERTCLYGINCRRAESRRAGPKASIRQRVFPDLRTPPQSLSRRATPQVRICA